jgi:hypothetical protein
LTNRCLKPDGKTTAKEGDKDCQKVRKYSFKFVRHGFDADKKEKNCCCYCKRTDLVYEKCRTCKREDPKNPESDLIWSEFELRKETTLEQQDPVLAITYTTKNEAGCKSFCREEYCDEKEYDSGGIRILAGGY